MKNEISEAPRDSGGRKISQRRYWMESWLVEVVVNNIQKMSDRERYVEMRVQAERDEEIRDPVKNLDEGDLDAVTASSDSSGDDSSIDEEYEDEEYDDEDEKDTAEPREELTKVQV
eukprot:TRINITY_DN9221_c0_g1_i1.p2 TRINITY_DN9221_c0_g1~~TRINITY_DN9221_c0_g1_i1.p2  ORF type:complete len:116 (+),score=36.73 TRINITY_DN9221_c0_g1_i1:48-395(+)